MDNITSYNPWYYYIGNELVKKKKPLSPGDYVHLHSIDGCFRVYEVKLTYFLVMKNRSMVKILWSDFRCKKGFGTSYESKIKKIINNLDSLKVEIDIIKSSLQSL